MYYQHLETNKAAKQQHDQGLKEDAAKRLASHQAWNKANKKK